MRLVGILASAGCGIADSSSPAAGNRGLISLEVSASIDTADNVRIDTLTATVDTAFKTTNAAVAFTTTGSTFTNGQASISVPVDSSGKARALLRAPQDAAVINVTAVAGGVARTQSIVFVPALPTWLNVTASPVVVAPTAGSGSDVTATFVRERGAVSPGGFMRFAVTSPSNGQVSARVSVDSMIAGSQSAGTRLIVLGTDTGSVFVRAAYTRDGRTISDSVRIAIGTGL